MTPWLCSKQFGCSVKGLLQQCFTSQPKLAALSDACEQPSHVQADRLLETPGNAAPPQVLCNHSLREPLQYWTGADNIVMMLRGEFRRPHVQKLVMLPRKNSCSRDLASHDTTMAAAFRLSAFRHRTVPMLSVSTSACMRTDAAHLHQAETGHVHTSAHQCMAD